MSKNKQQIKFEADVSGFNTNIKDATKNIKNLTNQLKLTDEKLKGNSQNTELLSDKIELLKEKYNQQSEVVENTRKKLEKAIEIYGLNSTEAENLENALLQTETAQQRIQNEIDKTNKQLEKQTDKTHENSKKWEESGKTLQKVGDKIDKLGNKVSILSGLTGGLAVASLKASIDFETSVTGVTKTVDGTEKQLADLRQGILDLSTQIPSSANEIAGVAENAGQLGIQTENILDFTKVMIDLGNSTNVVAEEASSSLAKFANVTKMSAKDYERLGSTIVALGNNYATTEADIISMGQNLASAGTQVGMSQSDIMALATALSSVGLEAQAGGTAFSKALVEMQLAVETHSKDLKNWANVAGMSTKEFSKLFKEDATSALEAFIKGLSKCGGESKSAIKVLDDMGITETRMRDALLRSANASDTFSSAIKLGSKAWEDNTALTEEAEKKYATTESQMKMLKNEITKTAIELGDQLAPSLRQIIKDAKPILNTISNMAKGFANLDDKTKKNILSMGALVVTAGPVLKGSGKIIKGIGTITSGAGTLSGTLKVLKGNTEGASEASLKLASSLKEGGLATGIAVTGGIALGTALVKATDATIAYITQSGKVTKELEKEIETTHKLSTEVENLKNSYDNKTSSIKENLENNKIELEYCTRLSSELATIIDSNGKIKTGYEQRADVILNELNEALGIEIERNGNLITQNGKVIESYQEIQKEIDNTIAKRKLEAEKEAYNELYKETVKEQLKAKQEYDKALKNYQEIQKKIDENTGDFFGIKTYNKIDQETRDAYYESIRLVNELAEHYQKLVPDEAEYFKKIVDLELQTSEIITAGMITQNEDYKKSLRNLAQTSEKEWQDIYKKADIAGKQAILKASTSKESMHNVINAWQELANNSAQAFKQGLSEIEPSLQAEILKCTTTTENLTPDMITAWKNLAEQSGDEYNKAIAELEPETKKQIEAVIGTIQTEKPKIVEETKKVAEESSKSMNIIDKMKMLAINNLKSYILGLSDEEQRKLLKNAGIENADEVINALKQESLSEDAGIKILQSFKNGLNNQNLRQQIFGSASGLTSGIISSIGKLGVSISANKIKGFKTGLDYVPYDNFIARLHKGERVLTAQENKEYMADNIGNKVSNRNITVNFYPQKMTEQELQNAERYIAMKWGMIT